MNLNVGMNPSAHEIATARAAATEPGSTVTYGYHTPGAGPAWTTEQTGAIQPTSSPAQHVYADCLGGEVNRYSQAEIEAAVDWLAENGREEDARRLAELTDSDREARALAAAEVAQGLRQERGQA